LDCFGDAKKYGGFAERYGKMEKNWKPGFGQVSLGVWFLSVFFTR